MNNTDFSVFHQPHIIFGAGRRSELPAIAARYGRHVLVITGSSALRQSGVLGSLLGQFRSHGLQYAHMTVCSEPHPDLVDRAVSCYEDLGIDVVVAIGGGSVLDAGKAVSAMLLKKEPVEQYIEGLPSFRPHDGCKVPFIAVPTTSGTGSEATDNAVISRVGKGGYKRSLRHPSFVPDIALIDPELMLSLPAGITVASGMDACTQLIEAYVSPSASPYTDALAWSGLEHVNRSFIASCTDGAKTIGVRADMAYAALLSGIALVNAGLGVVHGFASSLGGYIDIPHGMLCAVLLAAATRQNILRLREQGGEAALEKYARIGRLFSARDTAGRDEACDSLVEILENWQERLTVPRLSDYGLQVDALEDIANQTRCKNNPAALSVSHLVSILEERL